MIGPRPKKSGFLYSQEQGSSPQPQGVGGVPEEIARKCAAKTPLSRRLPIPTGPSAQPGPKPKDA
jgi:hypothetical protein